MVYKLYLTICVLFLLTECLVESRQIPSENQSTLLHRQKRSKEIVEKIKKLVVSTVGKASKKDKHSEKDSEKDFEKDFEKEFGKDFEKEFAKDFMKDFEKDFEKDSEASGSSHSYSSKGKEDHKHDDKHSHGGHEEHFDASTLIKSTLYTLLQTFKAIGGAATAISGKLIKVSGYGVSYGGKLFAASGDPITSLGKKIALKAMLLKPHDKSHSHESHHDDFSSHFPNELVEFNHPHDTTGFVHESPISHYGPLLDNGFDNQFANIHEPYIQYGQQWPTSYIHKRKSKSK